jgi:hypothetical protein
MIRPWEKYLFGRPTVRHCRRGRSKRGEYGTGKQFAQAAPLCLPTRRFQTSGFGAKGSHLIDNTQIYGVAVFGNFIILISVIDSRGRSRFGMAENRPLNHLAFWNGQYFVILSDIAPAIE